VRVGIGGSGPFGGGGQSAAAELGAARRAGLEVLFRDSRAALVDGSRAATCFSLDAAAEPLDAGEAWQAPPGERGLSKRVELEPLARSKRRPPEDRGAEQAFDTHDSRDGSASLHLLLRGSDSQDFEGLAVRVSADGGLHRHPLACELRARLSVLVLAASSDARPFAEFGLSEQPYAGGRAAGPDVLHYYLSNAGEPVEVVGRTVFLPVPYGNGWNDLVLELGADAREHASGGLDNALELLRLGVESRFQAPAEARFDALRIERGLTGAAALERERAFFRELEPAFGLRLLPGIAGPGPGGEQIELGSGAVPWSAAGSAEPRSNDGVVALSRLPFLPPAPAGGADTGFVLLDGRREELPDALAAWEGLLRSGPAPVALGAGGELGEPRGARIRGVRGLASFVLAPEPAEDALLAAIAAGRVSFGDPGAFQGGIDLEDERGFRMGQVVLTDRAAAAVRIVRHGVPAAEESYVWHTSAGRSDDRGERRIELPALPAFARVVVQGERAEAVAFSNALHFVRAFPPGGVSAERAAFDVAGVRCRAVRGLRLEDAKARDDGLGVSIEVRSADRGALVLELPSDGRVDVAWEGLEGASEQRGNELRLDALEGKGRVGLRWER
jgi:hypothetical protein